jgi:transposase InsO family protein
MWRQNTTWGEDRIAGELAKLGYRVSPRTVAKYRPAGLRRQRGQRWMTFIHNHLDETWACDFFVVVTDRFRVLYVFVVLSLERRRLVHFGVTERPSAGWAAQRIVEATADAARAPRFLVHDRDSDSIYGSQFRSRIRGLGTRLLVTPPRTPQANAFCERVIGTLRRDCLDHIIVRDERHAERVLGAYLGYYHGRPHRGLRMQPPDGGRHLAPRQPTRGTTIATVPILWRSPPSVRFRICRLAADLERGYCLTSEWDFCGAQSEKLRPHSVSCRPSLRRRTYHWHRLPSGPEQFS